MNTIAHHDTVVIGGVDTHKDIHVAAALDSLGRLIATESFPTTRHGYRRLLKWLQSHGQLDTVGVEGCGSWGAGLARFLTSRGVRVLEVNRPNRQERRRRGKSDTLDAEAAARAVISGQASATPKTGDGPVEALRQLRVARNGAMKARTAAANQIHSLCDTAPDRIRAQLHSLSMRKKVALAERWRPGTAMTPETAAKRSIASVARRWRALDDEARMLRAHTKAILDEIAAPLLAVHGVGYDTAAQLLITAGDNPHRLGNERSFAALCGTSPTHNSSGKRSGRLTLNRGGDRHANSALWRIVIVRMGTQLETKHYVERRTKEGMPTIEIIRCLKRYVARELFPHIAAITTPERLRGAA